jgi:hypothetical protein
MTKPVAVVPATQDIDLFNDFATDDKADDGVWVEYRGGVEFLIAYTKNRKFKNRASYFYKKNSKMLEAGGEVAADKLTEITIQVMAETVLLDWRGPMKLQGEVLTYNVTNAKRLLALEGFREWVSKQSEDLANFKAVQEAEDLGN